MRRCYDALFVSFPFLFIWLLHLFGAALGGYVCVGEMEDVCARALFSVRVSWLGPCLAAAGRCRVSQSTD